MYVHIYIYIHICVCIYTYIYIFMYIHVYIYMYIRIYTYIFMYAYTYICIHIYLCRCICIYMFIYMSAYVSIICSGRDWMDLAAALALTACACFAQLQPRSNALLLKRTNHKCRSKTQHRHHHSLVRASATNAASDMLPLWLHDECAWVDAHAIHRGSKCIRSPCQKKQTGEETIFLVQIEEVTWAEPHSAQSLASWTACFRYKSLPRVHSSFSQRLVTSDQPQPKFKETQINFLFWLCWVTLVVIILLFTDMINIETTQNWKIHGLAESLCMLCMGVCLCGSVDYVRACVCAWEKVCYFVHGVCLSWQDSPAAAWKSTAFCSTQCHGEQASQAMQAQVVEVMHMQWKDNTRRHITTMQEWFYLDCVHGVDVRGQAGWLV